MQNRPNPDLDTLNSLLRRIESLEDRLDESERCLGEVRRRARKNASNIDLNWLVSIAFFLGFIVVIVSLKVQYGGISYSVDLVELANILQVPIWGTIVAGGFTWAMKKQEQKSSERPKDGEKQE